jgi:DNA polymerase-1
VALDAPPAKPKPNPAAARDDVKPPAKHLYLVDGSGYIFRAFFAVARGAKPKTRADGTPTGAVYGFTQMLLRLIDKALADKAADYLAVVFDKAERSFRNEIYPEYKAHRPDPPEDLVPQFPLVREATRAMGLPCLELDDYEADDIIASYACKASAEGIKVTIVSSDKDLMQLVGASGDGVPIEMFDPMKEKEIGPAEVMEKFGVPPEKVIDVQALAGDSVDNVPGVPGIGVKTAAELINTYGDLETLLARAGEIKQPKRRETLLANAEKARISKRLVTLKTDLPLPMPVEAMALAKPDPEKLRPFLVANNFKSILARLGLAPAAADVPTQPELPAPGAAAAPTRTLPAPAAAAAPAALDAKIDRSAYALVQDEVVLKEWIARAFDAGLLGFDTETTSLDAMRAEIVGFSLALGPGDACYVPVAHVKGPVQQGLPLEPPGSPRAHLEPEEKGIRQIPRARALELMKPLLEDDAVLKIGHNIKYDAQVLTQYGIAIAPVDDTILMSFVLDAGKKNSHGMDELAQEHLGHANIGYEELCGSGKAQIGFAEVPLERARDYAAEDADVTWRFHALFRPRLVTERLVTVYETIERPLVPVIAAMEREGITVDPAALEALSKDFAERMAEHEAEAHRLAGAPFNIGSPKQLGEILFEKLQLPGGRKGKTGAYGTDSSVLEGLAAAHPLPRTVLDWRQLQKLKSTYADALLQQINPATRRVHTCFSMTGAQTGRLSSTDPNLQNIPVRTEEGRKIRRAFVAAKGRKLISLDYSQIELRLLAHVADMEVLKKAFRDGLDIHAMTASQVFGVPIEGMDPNVRRRAKTINFGIIYGISAFGLANQLGIGKNEAAAYIEAYFQRYPGIRDYMERTKDFARRNGFVATPFGRRIHITGFSSQQPGVRSFAERQSINAPLQGGAADVIKRAMIRIPEALAARKLEAKMLLQVHDELLFEAPEAEVEATIATLKPVMEKAALPAVRLSVPLVVDAGFGDNWAEAH